MIPADFDWMQPNYDVVYDARMSALNAIREPGFDLAALHDFYRENPTKFIDDWAMTADPRNAERGLPVVVPFILFKRQQEFIEWLHERWKSREDGVVEKSRDMGLSWLCCGFSVWMLVFHPDSVVGIGSRKEDYVDAGGNPASLFWKIRTLIELMPEEFQPPNWNIKTDAPHMRVLNRASGASIVGEAGTNIGRGNRTSIYFVDESAFLEDADSVDAALSQTSNCKIHVSTPNGAGNLFYRKRHGGKLKVFTFSWRQDPRKDRAWYQRQTEILDPVVVAAELDLDYTASVSNSYIPGRFVTAAQHRGPLDVSAIGPVMVGVDPARFGNDKSCITFRQGRVVFPQEVFGKVDVVDCAGRVTDAIRLWPEKVDQIAVDTIGIGAGVADILRRTFGDIVVDVNSSIQLDDGQNYNLRARMWRDMLVWIKAGASIPADPELFTDLTALQYGYRGGRLLIESKDDMKKRGMKSPDRADSIGLTFAYPPAVREVELPPSPQWSVLDTVTGW